MWLSHKDGDLDLHPCGHRIIDLWEFKVQHLSWPSRRTVHTKDLKGASSVIVR